MEALVRRATCSESDEAELQLAKTKHITTSKKSIQDGLLVGLKARFDLLLPILKLIFVRRSDKLHEIAQVFLFIKPFFHITKHVKGI